MGTTIIPVSGAGGGTLGIPTSTVPSGTPGLYIAEITYDMIDAAIQAGQYFRDGSYCTLSTGVSQGANGTVFAQRNLSGGNSQGWDEFTVVYGPITDVFPDFPWAAGGSGSPAILMCRTDCYTTDTSIDEMLSGCGIVYYNGVGQRTAGVGAFVRPITSGTQMRAFLPLAGTASTGATLSGFTNPSTMTAVGQYTGYITATESQNTPGRTLAVNRSTGGNNDGGTEFGAQILKDVVGLTWYWAVGIGQNVSGDTGTTRDMECRYFIAYSELPTDIGISI